MNVFMVGKNWNTPRSGGLDRYFVDLASHLERSGANPTALVHDAGPVTPSFVHGFGRPGDTVITRWLGARRMGRSLLQHSEVDLVNFHFALYAFPHLDLIRDDMPVVCNFHGPWAEEGQVEQERSSPRQKVSAWLRYRLKRYIEQRVYRHSDRFIVLSSAFQQVLHREYRVPLERISVIPGGVDTDRFRPLCSRAEARREMGWPLDRPIIVAVRRLARRMGLENLIDAMSVVRQRCPDALLIIGGRGALEGELRRRIQEKNLQRNVRLVGFIPEQTLPLAYRAADFSVVPTVALEGFGLIITESLACGTPCLGTPVGGIPEVLLPFDHHLVFESAEAAALADRISAVLTGHVALPDEQACRGYAVDQFSWERVTRRVLQVFNQTREGSASEARALSGP